jgi:hypothetical protein
LGKNGRSRSICSSVSQNRSLIPVSSRSLNQIVTLTSMGPDPSNDPYVLGANDPDLAGYGAVLRYWQRVSTFYREGEVSRGLLQRLLGRELGFWNVRIFRVMAARKGMYVRGPIVDLAHRISIGEGRSAFEEGERDGRRMVPPEHDQSEPRLRDTIA